MARKMTKAEKAAVGKRMKAYWAKWRKEKTHPAKHPSLVETRALIERKRSKTPPVTETIAKVATVTWTDPAVAPKTVEVHAVYKIHSWNQLTMLLEHADLDRVRLVTV